MTLRTVAIDDRRYQIHFHGFERPLSARSACGRQAELAPWTWRRHRSALRDCSHLAEGALVLDPLALATQVLGPSAEAAAQCAAFASLALWWAAGGDEAPIPDTVDEGWHEFGRVSARLRRWRERERLSALVCACAGLPAGESVFDAFAYLDAMLRASVAEVAPAVVVDDLDAGTLARLLPMVVALNVVEPDDMPPVLRGPAGAQTARETLAICRLLGWTPSQVWAAPAAEVSRVLQLAELATAAEVRTTTAMHADERPRRGIAEHPDAVVIRFE